MTTSATESAWRTIFEALAIRDRLVANGAVEIHADEIKRIGRREPRLMTKFDTREARPAALNDITILPVSNGRYVLLRGDGYADLPTGQAPLIHWPLSRNVAALLTLPFAQGPSSESQALDMASACGILRHFLRDDAILTVRGRLRSPRFAMLFEGVDRLHQLTIDGIQIEVDSGLEGTELHLVEAKLGSRSNFHIRQLYFPLRMWTALASGKRVSTVFMTWSNRRYQFRRYTFSSLERYHSLVLENAADYIIDPSGEVPSLHEILAATTEQPLPVQPFPQADDMRKVIDVVDAVGSGLSTRQQIARRFDFNQRQADYYGNAAAFIGLLDRMKGGFQLSHLGATFVRSPLLSRHRTILERLAIIPVFRQALEHLAVSHDAPSTGLIAEWIVSRTALSGTTPRRRAVTVAAWAGWCNTATKQLEMLVPAT